MSPTKAYPSFDAYVEDQPAANQAVIRALRTLVKRAAPALEEQLGVLIAALVTGLSSGTLKVRGADGTTQSWPVSGGFFEVSNNRATVLADAVG